MADSALAYAARGWSVIVMQPRGKRPLVAWPEFQRRIASEDEIACRFRCWPDANVGIVTGRVSGIVVVDKATQAPGQTLDSAPWRACSGGFIGARRPTSTTTTRPPSSTRTAFKASTDGSDYPIVAERGPLKKPSS